MVPWLWAGRGLTVESEEMKLPVLMEREGARAGGSARPVVAEVVPWDTLQSRVVAGFAQDNDKIADATRISGVDAGLKNCT